MTDGESHIPQEESARTYFDPEGNYVGAGEPLDPPDGSSELAVLMGFLDRQRATFAWKVGGLGAAELRTRPGDSEMTLGGMLKHLARFEDDMSIEWLQGKPQIAPWNEVDWESDGTWDWRTASGDTPEQLYAMWQDAVNRSRPLFARAVADETARRTTPDSPGVTAEASRVPYILANMIEEYARHNGHADLIRESIDGLVGHDPPE